MFEMGTASVKSADLEKTVEAGDGLDCHLPVCRGHRSRGWLLSTPSSLARAQAERPASFAKTLINSVWRIVPLR
jgi:hypothetical protein